MRHTLSVQRTVHLNMLTIQQQASLGNMSCPPWHRI
jgi:hypothetical protein